jgi:endonuclease YncB( thermonuclease family)
MNPLGLLLFLLALPAFARTEISGTALVIDGDTINVVRDGRYTPVRLFGIAAPELKQPGGKAALDHLERIAENKPVRCVLESKRIEQFEIGTCHVGGRDLSAAMVKAGLARDCPSYSGGRYAALETAKARTLALPDYCRR